MQSEHRPRKLTLETERQNCTWSTSCASSLVPHQEQDNANDDDDPPVDQQKDHSRLRRGWTRDAVTRYWDSNNRTWFEETTATSEEAVVTISTMP
jgi:hypothetical protein